MGLCALLGIPSDSPFKLWEVGLAVGPLRLDLYVISFQDVLLLSPACYVYGRKGSEGRAPPPLPTANPLMGNFCRYARWISSAFARRTRPSVVSLVD